MKKVAFFMYPTPFPTLFSQLSAESVGTLTERCSKIKLQEYTKEGVILPRNRAPYP